VFKFISFLKCWGIAILMMAAIFAISSRPSDQLPSFGGWDYFIKKSGHVLGYGLLALAYLHGLNWEKNRLWVAWLLAVLYSITDELHQGFVPGRRPSVWDVLLFDNLGAVFALLIYYRAKG
jgi:VanZ family protein